METFLVGGAVRDKLLGITPTERDWVVVGATPEQMLQLGFQPVGKDFPVFLHPQTHEEHALARTERKQGHGYTGFAIHAAPEVTLEQDLSRRDLTVNAMAEDAAGNIIDPYGGQSDLTARILRHVSPAFTEDPLRVLRVARFSARFHRFGFTVAPQTIALMATISASGELDFLVAERVWRELERALCEPHPEVFFQTLRSCNALAVLLPELDALFGVPQPAAHHPEVDTGVHSLMALQQATRLSPDAAVRFATLVHDLGKALTPPAKWPRHIAHEHQGLALIKALCLRLKVPNDCSELAALVCKYHTHIHRANELKPETILKVIEACDGIRRPDRFAQFLLACEADSRGRTGFEQRDYPQAMLFADALQACLQCNARELATQGLDGKEIGIALRKLRLAAIRRLKKNQENPA